VEAMRLSIFIFLALMMSQNVSAQSIQDIKLDPVKVEKYLPYIKWKHSYGDGFEAWKENNKLAYAGELWYYTESFYIKRDHFSDGLVLNEEIIDVARWEHARKPNEEVIVRVIGFKDALVLIPGNKLIYTPWKKD
jgi:hypothetical protein